MRQVKLWLLAILLVVGYADVLTSCSSDDNPIEDVPPQKEHTEAVCELMHICSENAEVRQLLEHAIRQAATINPDRRYNPAQTLEEFYDFVDWNVRHLPWEVMTTSSPTEYGQSLYGDTSHLNS